MHRVPRIMSTFQCYYPLYTRFGTLMRGLTQAPYALLDANDGCNIFLDLFSDFFGQTFPSLCVLLRPFCSIQFLCFSPHVIWYNEVQTEYNDALVCYSLFLLLLLLLLLLHLTVECIASIDLNTRTIRHL